MYRAFPEVDNWPNSWKLHNAYVKHMNAYSLPTIPVICMCNFFTVKGVILISVSYFVHQATSKTSEQLVRIFNWQQIFFWLNVREAVTLIGAIGREYSLFSLVNTMFICHNRLYPQLMGYRKWFLHKFERKVAYRIVALRVETMRHITSEPIKKSRAG